LKQNGFSVKEIDNMDYLQKESIIHIIKKNNRKKDIKNQLLLAECINNAYVGSQPKIKGTTGEHQQQFARWKEKKMQELYPDYKKQTVWDTLSEVKQKRKKIVIR